MSSMCREIDVLFLRTCPMFDENSINLLGDQTSGMIQTIRASLRFCQQERAIMLGNFFINIYDPLSERVLNRSPIYLTVRKIVAVSLNHFTLFISASSHLEWIVPYNVFLT